MPFPRDLVIKRLNQNIDTVIRNVSKRANRLFLDEINSTHISGDASPFLKTLFPQLKIASMVERSFTAAWGRGLDHLVKDIAEAIHGNAQAGYQVSGTIPATTAQIIDDIVEDYTRGSGHSSPGTDRELEQIFATCTAPGARAQVTESDDVFFVSKYGVENHIEIKTPKPNYDQSKNSKRRILRIHAVRFPEQVRCFVAMPYNPNGFYGKYKWPVTKYFLDRERDLMVGKQFWNYLGDQSDTYDQLMDCFFTVEKTRRQDIIDLLQKAQ